LLQHLPQHPSNLLPHQHTRLHLIPQPRYAPYIVQRGCNLHVLEPALRLLLDERVFPGMSAQLHYAGFPIGVGRDAGEFGDERVGEGRGGVDAEDVLGYFDARGVPGCVTEDVGGEKFGGGG
jgi:hypothetical protein